MVLSSGVPNPQQQIESLQRELYQRNREIADLREELRQERGKANQVEIGAASLRVILRPLHNALLQVFGEMDDMGVGAASVNGIDPRKTAVWEDWKKKLGGKAADAIDALHTHGEMTHTQLKIHMKCGQQTVYDTVHRLNKAGIINKNGGKVSLKEL
jgi:hypothetical protein